MSEQAPEEEAPQDTTGDFRLSFTADGVVGQGTAAHPPEQNEEHMS